jgi:formylmethanofuran--tetrahydromethanopterin N-formyltransferase
MPKINLEKLEGFSEYGEGFGCSLLITGPNEKRIQRIGVEFAAYSYLQYGGSEVGIQTYLSPDETPDNRFGVVCSIWIKNPPVTPNQKKTDQIIAKLIKHINRRIKYVLFPHFNLTIFDWTPNPMYFVDCEEHLGVYGDGFQTLISISYKERIRYDIVAIPMMGGVIRIQKQIGIAPGFIGITLFLHLSSVDFVFDIDDELQILLQNQKEVTQIHGLVACGSKFIDESESSTHEKISTNHRYCPTLRKNENFKSKVQENIACIPELIINGYNEKEIFNSLKIILIELLNNPLVLKIEGANYEGLLGLKKFEMKKMLEK